jgi:hypothetical protein
MFVDLPAMSQYLGLINCYAQRPIYYYVQYYNPNIHSTDHRPRTGHCPHQGQAS